MMSSRNGGRTLVLQALGWACVVPPVVLAALLSGMPELLRRPFMRDWIWWSVAGLVCICGIFSLAWVRRREVFLARWCGIGGHRGWWLWCVRALAGVVIVLFLWATAPEFEPHRSGLANVALAVKWILAPVVWGVAAAELALEVIFVTHRISSEARRMVDLFYVPGHKDGGAGLRPIVQYVVLGLAPFYAGTVALAALVSASGIEAFAARIREQYHLRDDLVPFASCGLLAGLLLALGPAVQVTWKLHRYMKERVLPLDLQHERALQRWGTRYAMALEQESLECMVRSKEELAQLRSCEPHECGHREWPLDLGAVAKLFAPAVVAAGGLLATAIEKALLAP